jgi:hypothetical protein
MEGDKGWNLLIEEPSLSVMAFHPVQRDHQPQPPYYASA